MRKEPIIFLSVIGLIIMIVYSYNPQGQTTVYIHNASIILDTIDIKLTIEDKVLINKKFYNSFVMPGGEIFNFSTRKKKSKITSIRRYTFKQHSGA